MSCSGISYGERKKARGGASNVYGLVAYKSLEAVSTYVLVRKESMFPASHTSAHQPFSVVADPYTLTRFFELEVL